MGAGASAFGAFENGDAVIDKAREILAAFPENRCVKHLVALKDSGALDALSAEDLVGLFACAKTGLENQDSGLGCYAMSPGDYDKYAMFFDAVCNDYHNNPAGDKVHTTNWSLDGVEGLPEDGQLDISKLGLKEVGAWGHCGRGNRKGCALISCAVLAARCRRDSLFFF